MTTIDFSPAMLALFLRGRVTRAGIESAFLEPSNLISGEKAERRRIIRIARVTKEEFERAWDGHLKAAGIRVRLWAAIGFVPADFGVMLTSDGGQAVVGDDLGKGKAA
jgi:hypothetical protein